jgi:hypothetical protein
LNVKSIGKKGWMSLVWQSFRTGKLWGFMRKLFISLFLAAALLSGAACAAETTAAKAGESKDEKSAFGFLEAWVGNMPDAILPNDPSGFKPQPAIWEKPEINKLFLKALGPDRMKQLTTGWGAEKYFTNFVRRFGDIVYFSSCRAGGGGACAAPLAIVYISIKDGKVQVCWEDGDGDFWFGSSREPRKLTPGYCNPDKYSEPSRGEPGIMTIYVEQNRAN